MTRQLARNVVTAEDPLELHNSGDAQAFSDFVVEYTPKLQRYLAARGIAKHDREDILQELFLKLHLHAPQYQPRRSLDSWVFTLLRNLLCDRFRQNIPTIVTLPGEVALSDDSSSYGEGAVFTREQINSLQAAIVRLPVSQRKVLIAHCIQGESLKQIAGRLRIPLNTAKAYLHRAKLKLSRFISEKECRENEELKRLGLVTLIISLCFISELCHTNTRGPLAWRAPSGLSSVTYEMASSDSSILEKVRQVIKTRELFDKSLDITEQKIDSFEMSAPLLKNVKNQRLAQKIDSAGGLASGSFGVALVSPLTFNGTHYSTPVVFKVVPDLNSARMSIADIRIVAIAELHSDEARVEFALRTLEKRNLDGTYTSHPIEGWLVDQQGERGIGVDILETMEDPEDSVEDSIESLAERASPALYVPAGILATAIVVRKQREE